MNFGLCHVTVMIPGEGMTGIFIIYSDGIMCLIGYRDINGVSYHLCIAILLAQLGSNKADTPHTTAVRHVYVDCR